MAEKSIVIISGGLVTIGVIVALFAPGRQTVNGLKVGFNGLSGLFRTVERG